MTREEINKFSGVEPYCFETDREEDWYKMGCIDGLEAADAEPNIRRLWHNPSEEPQDDLELIIYKYKDNFWFTRKQNIIKYLDEADAAEYTELVTNAVNTYKASKTNKHKKPYQVL